MLQRCIGCIKALKFSDFPQKLLSASLVSEGKEGAVCACVADQSAALRTVKDIDPTQVKLYVDPPPRFEKVAILESNSDASWRSPLSRKPIKPCSA